MLRLPPSLHLRPLQLSDLAAVVAIEQHAFPTPTKEKTFQYEINENKLAHYQALTIRKDTESAQLVGYAGYWVIANEVHISTIAVDPKWRGHGLGELILVNILYLAYTHEAALVTLEVRVSNLVAQTLYGKYGFELVGRRPRYYKDTGEDALLMTVFLQSNQPYRHFLDQKANLLLARLAGTSF